LVVLQKQLPTPAAPSDNSEMDARLRQMSTERSALSQGFVQASAHRTQLHSELGSLQDQMQYLEQTLLNFTVNPVEAVRPLDLGKKFYLIGGTSVTGDEEQVLNEIIECDTADGLRNTKPMAPMPSSRFCAGVALVNEKIYVVGGAPGRAKGCPPEVPFSSVEVFDFRSGSWMKQIEMPAEHGGVCWPGVVADGASGKVYVIGGLANRASTEDSSNHSYSSKQVSILDTTTGEWSCGGEIGQYGRAVFGCAILDGKIYISGGSKGKQGVVPETNVYNPATKEWKQLADMPYGRLQHKMLSAGGKLWALAGLDSAGMPCNDVGCYDPAKDSWSSCEGLVPPKLNSAAAAMGDCLYLFGGKNPSSEEVVDTIDRFNITTQQWDKPASLPFARKAMMAVSTLP